jgi:hypothetical protein
MKSQSVAAIVLGFFVLLALTGLTESRRRYKQAAKAVLQKKFAAVVKNTESSEFLKELKQFNDPKNEFCWKDSYGRGVGLIPTGCPEGKVNQAGLCYRPCSSGFKGVGPVCWAHCAGKYRDHGLTCYRNFFSWYFKKSYGRGAGTIPNQCYYNKENQAGLCYRPCSSGYYGVGPVCWKNCRESTPFDCGAACGSSRMVCAKKIFGMVKSVLMVVKNVASIVATLGGTAAIESSLKASLKAGLTIAKDFAMKHLNKEAFVKFMKSKGRNINTDTLKQMYQQSKTTSIDQAVEYLETLDPTGIATAVKSFVHAKC